VETGFYVGGMSVEEAKIRAPKASRDAWGLDGGHPSPLGGDGHGESFLTFGVPNGAF